MAAEFKDKGNEAYKAGDFEKAVEFYTMGIEQEPSNAALFSNRSAAYLKSQDYEKARRDAEMCIELNIVWSKVRCFPNFFLGALISLVCVCVWGVPTFSVPTFLGKREGEGRRRVKGAQERGR